MFGSFSCPYSYLASLRVDRLQAAGAAGFEWRAVVHAPDIPAEGAPVDEKSAVALDEELKDVRGLLSRGEPFAAKRPTVQSNTTAAVAGYCSLPPVGADADALRSELFEAYWVRGADLGNPMVLYELRCPVAPPGETMWAWQSQWSGTDRAVVPMMLLPDGRVSRGLGVLARLADMEREMVRVG